MIDIRQLADELVEALRPGCERIALAGSLRRSKAQPRDIEICAVPLRETGYASVDLFGDPYDFRDDSLLDETIEVVIATSAWDFDTNVRRNGPKYKRLLDHRTGVACDLFIADADNWGNIFTIRTGPGDFSQALVTRARRLGLKQDGGYLWRTHRDGTRTVVVCREELDYFAALQVPWLEPAARTVDALRRVTA
jgi:DNA polymerase/3'-5' exonuclease PolX